MTTRTIEFMPFDPSDAEPRLGFNNVVILPEYGEIIITVGDFESSYTLEPVSYRMFTNPMTARLNPFTRNEDRNRELVGPHGAWCIRQPETVPHGGKVSMNQLFDLAKIHVYSDDVINV